MLQPRSRQMTVGSNVTVTAPKKWMDGWDKIYSRMLSASDDDLSRLDVGPRIQQLEHALAITESDTQNMNILELGCGDGAVACYLAKIGCQVTAVDALASAIAVAQRRSKILKLDEKVKFRLDDMDGWSIVPESFDVVIALQCLQYLFDRTIPRMREAIAGVKPGGFFVYSGNILPHNETDPPIRFVNEEELKSELEGWTLHGFGTEERILKPGDLRGYVWTVARKPV
ncbi:MAG: class I SAM-dependent methyltransferase [Candidatus Thorarchaeota archaeon]|nr:MAG: class I SAM-dependent methyltransferase [Candidatus Thorarchaeota archaeon]